MKSIIMFASGLTIALVVIGILEYLQPELPFTIWEKAVLIMAGLIYARIEMTDNKK